MSNEIRVVSGVFYESHDDTYLDVLGVNVDIVMDDGFLNPFGSTGMPSAGRMNLPGVIPVGFGLREWPPWSLSTWISPYDYFLKSCEMYNVYSLPWLLSIDVVGHFIRGRYQRYPLYPFYPIEPGSGNFADNVQGLPGGAQGYFPIEVPSNTSSSVMFQAIPYADAQGQYFEYFVNVQYVQFLAGDPGDPREFMQADVSGGFRPVEYPSDESRYVMLRSDALGDLRTSFDYIKSQLYGHALSTRVWTKIVDSGHSVHFSKIPGAYPYEFGIRINAPGGNVVEPVAVRPSTPVVPPNLVIDFLFGSQSPMLSNSGLFGIWLKDDPD